MWYGKIAELNIWKNDGRSNRELIRSPKKEIQCPGETVVFYMGDQLLEADIVELNLSVRSFNCLKRAGWNYIGDILKNIESWQDLLRIRNLGKNSADEIIKNLIDYQKSLLKEQGGSVVIRCDKPKESVGEIPDMPDEDKDISELNLSVRSYNCLRRAGYSKVGALRRDIKNGLNLRGIRNIGTRCETEILQVLNGSEVRD